MDSLFATAPIVGSEYEHIRRRAKEVTGAADRIDQMWHRLAPLLDPHFALEFATAPKERVWELQLGTLLIDAGYRLVPKGPEGPDFKVLLESGHVWVEATAPGAGNREDAIPEPPLNSTFDYPEEQIILRLRGAMKAKLEQYSAHRASGMIADDEPFVIAISSTRFPILLDADNTPAILKAVLPIGAPQLVINTQTRETIENRMQYRPALHRPSGRAVTMDCFLDGAYSYVSAVAFSPANFLYEAQRVRDELIVIHNPLAANPLPQG